MALRIAVLGGDTGGRERVFALVRAAPSGHVVVASESPDAADVVIVVADGASLGSRIRSHATSRPVIVVDEIDRPDVDAEAYRAGASGYVSLEGLEPARLDKWIRYAQQSAVSRIDGDLAIALALARGTSVAEAARIAGVSERTVYRRRTDPAFRAGVERLRSQIIEGAVAISAERLATGGLAPGAAPRLR